MNNSEPYDGEIHALSKEYAFMCCYFNEPMNFEDSKLKETLDLFIKKYVNYICEFDQKLLCDHLYSCLMLSSVNLHTHSFHDYVHIIYRHAFPEQSMVGETSVRSKPSLCLKFKRAPNDNLGDPVEPI